MSLKVAIYQGGVLSKDGEENFNKIDEVLREQKSKGEGEDTPDIVVFPELFLGGYNAAHLSFGLEGGNDPKAKLQEIVKKHKIAICIGWVEFNPPSSSPSSPPYKNISLILNKEGEIILSHTKTHLWDTFENENFLKGEGLPGCADLCGVKVSTIICYEVEFPEIVREMRNKGTEVLLIPTGVCVPSSPSPSSPPSPSGISKYMIPCRAMENNMYICYVNRAGQEGEMNFIGNSIIADPFGNPLAQLNHLPQLSQVFELKSDKVKEAISRNPYRRDYRPEIFEKKKEMHE